jgi:hypothetical protein
MAKRSFLSLQHLKENRGRWLLFLGATAAVLFYGWFQYRVGERLRQNAGATAELFLQEKLYCYSRGLKTERLESVEKLLRRMKVAYIIVDERGEPLEWTQLRYPRFSVMRGAPVRNTDPPFILRDELRARVEAFGKTQPPLFLNLPDAWAKKYRIYYHYPFWITAQMWFLTLELFILMVFIYVFYTGIKNHDLIKQANLWVNFAKETAHQLGTPLSSLYGWLEMLKMKLLSGGDDDIDKVKYVLDEAIEDVKKLNKRVFRFSQIGSEPELSAADLNEVVREVVAYFRDRLPHAERTIQLVANYDRLPLLSLNRDLMGWVIENLLKNSMDAIQKKEGIIQIETTFQAKENRVRITHTDNGGGIKKENVGKIFNAGFSTKKHGWGLGLALAKRIVTDYHHGRIYVESTQVDRGTTFVVELPVRQVFGETEKERNG